jgi:glycosyltransferase involved in cell wall biosynthesis
MFHTNVKISVVLSSFNGAQFIEEQINSIIEQSMLPNEIIVCDDGSTDGTIEILKNFEAKNAIKLFLNPKNIGITANFKKGVSLTNPANYIAFCDQDDIWLPNKLSSNWNTMLKMESLQNNQKLPFLVYSDLKFINQNGVELNPSFYNHIGLDKFEHCFDTALFGSLLLGCTIFINPVMRSHFLAMPDSKIYYHDAWLALLGWGIGKVAFINDPLVKYRLHSNNVSMPNFKPRSRFINLIKHLIQLPFRSNYLNNEINLAEKFDSHYNYEITSKKKLLLANFISLKNKRHFQKKWAFEKAFINKWTKRF